VKGDNGEFSNTGTGGNISRGDHPTRSTRFKDNGVTLFVKRVESLMIGLLGRGDC